MLSSLFQSSTIPVLEQVVKFTESRDLSASVIASRNASTAFAASRFVRPAFAATFWTKSCLVTILSS